MDFSSLDTDKELFQEKPKAYLIKHYPDNSSRQDRYDRYLERNPENVFSVVEKDVRKNHTLEIRWQIDWENLNKYNSALR